MLLLIAIFLALLWALCVFLWHLTGWVYILLFLAVTALIMHLMTIRER